jgi:hypothetical protein
MGDAEETTPFLLILLLILIFVLGWCGDWISGWDAHSAPAQENLAHAAAIPSIANHTEVPRVTTGNFVHDTMVRHTLTDMR